MIRVVLVIVTALLLDGLTGFRPANAQVSPAWVIALPLDRSPIQVLTTGRWLNAENRVIANVGDSVRVYGPDGSPDPAWQELPYLIASMNDVLLADMTGDGVVEVINTGSLQIQGNGGNAVMVRDALGAVIPGWPVLQSAPVADIVAGDLDGQPGAELLLVDTPPPRLRVLRGDGQPMPGWPVYIPYPGGSFTEAWAGTSIADLDMDGTPEIVACPVFFRSIPLYTPTYVFNPSGSLRSGWPFHLQTEYLSWPIVADVNGDFACEIGGGATNQVAVLQRQGQYYFWPVPLLPCSFDHWPCAAADVTGDGTVDFVTSGGCLSVLDMASQTYGTPFALPLTVFFNPLIGDVNGDGSLDIVVPAQNNDPTNPSLDPRLYVFDSNLQPFPGFPVHLEPYTTLPPNQGEIRREAVALGDLNGDGDMEIVIGFTSRILMFDLPNQGNPSTDYAWTHWRGNAAANGFLYEGRYPPAYYRRGDANRDAQVDVADVPAMLRRLFLGQPTKCLAQYDFNDDDTVDLVDPMELLMYLFAGGPMAPGAYPNCEVTQPLTEPLGCYEYECP